MNDEDRRVLALAFSANAEELSVEDRERLEELLRKGGIEEPPRTEDSAGTADEDGSSEGDDEDAALSPRPGLPRRVLLVGGGVVLAVASFAAGIGAHQLWMGSPYLSAEEIAGTTGQFNTSVLEVSPPTSAEYDPGSLYLSAIIDDNPVWIGTRDAGAQTCFYVDFGIPEVNIDACAPVTPPLSVIGITPNDSRLPADKKGQYTLNVYEGALPFVSFTPAA